MRIIEKCVLCVMVITLGCQFLCADDQAKSLWDAHAAEEPNIRLNYITTPWTKVLNDLATKSGSTLVMHDAPPGKFSRQDWNRYNRVDAVRVLNRELEEKGFRILIKDQFLTVIQARRSRAEYPRPVVPHTNSVAQPVDEYNQPKLRIHQVQHLEQGIVQIKDRATLAPHPFEKPRAIQPRAIQPGAIQPRTIQHNSNRHILLSSHEETPEQEETQASVSVKTRNRPALDIARQIHAAFEKRSRLKDIGPNGLPGFVVSDFIEEGKDPEDLFTIEIDTEKNEILITGPAQVQTGIRNLIQHIDTSPLNNKNPATIVSGDGDLAEAGRKLQHPLEEISNVRKQTMIAQGGTSPSEAGTGTMTPGKTAVIGKGNDGLPALIGNLKGDVSIEALDDLDLLILRGNEKDVAAVMQVIQAVEQMAIGSLPEIHLLKLQHVDSQSLAQLLNDVYQQLSELRSENAQQSATSVNVVPVVTPNAVLILAPSNTMEAILQLADELDQPINPDHQVKIFRLKHAVSSSVVTMLNEFYGEEPVGLGTRIRVTADPRTNSVVVQARPRDLTEITKLIQEVDSDTAHSVSQLEIFPLKSAVADELAEFLSAAVQSVSDPRASTVAQTSSFQNNSNNANQEAKAVVLEFLAEDGQRLLRSGLLTDIRFNADPRTNSLMVTAPKQSMQLIGELIRILDRPSETVAEIKVFPLRNSDAVDAVELLQELFGDNNNQSNNSSENRELGAELIGTQGSASSLIALKFSVDTRSNSVVAVGGADSLRVVEAILYRLDANEARTRKTEVVKLRNVASADVANAINQFLQSQRDLATIDPDRISTSQLLEQEVIVTPEEISNSLMISATPKYFDEIMRLTKQLDAEPSQVIIQALLVEVELDNTDEFGVELGFQDSILFDRGLLGEMVNITDTIVNGTNTTVTTATNAMQRPVVPGFGFNNQPLGINNANPSRVGSQGLSSFALGRVNNDFGYGGLVLSASSESVSVLIRALAARRNLRVLSRPQVLALDNQLAQIQVGQVVPVSDGVTINNNSVIPIITRDPAGIILTVTPRISPEGQVVMEVVAEKSVYTDQGVTVFTDAATGTQVTSPIKNITTAQSTVKIPDGQTVVMGGMITQSDDSIERKVPWLGDLPILGSAFRYDTFNNRRTELLIFLTPRVIRNAAVSETIKQVEAQRLHWNEYEAEEVHGPIFAIPNEMAMPIDGTSIEMLPADAYPIEMGPGIPDAGTVPPQPSTSYVAPVNSSVQKLGSLSP